MFDKIKKIDKLAKKNDTEKLEKFLYDKDPALRVEFCKAVAANRIEALQGSLVIALRDGETPVRRAAVEALQVLGDSNVIEHLRRAMNAEKDESLKEVMHDVMQKLSHHA